jgi:hypothetical protein
MQTVLAEPRASPGTVARVSSLGIVGVEGVSPLFESQMTFSLYQGPDSGNSWGRTTPRCHDRFTTVSR